MRLLLIGVLALAACSTPLKLDLLNGIKRVDDAEQIQLTGLLVLNGGDFRLYPNGPAGGCISGTLLSLAGIPTPEYSNRTMAVTGYLHVAGTETAGATKDDCKAGMVLHATEVTTP